MAPVDFLLKGQYFVGVLEHIFRSFYVNFRHSSISFSAATNQLTSIIQMSAAVINTHLLIDQVVNDTVPMAES